MFTPIRAVRSAIFARMNETNRKSMLLILDGWGINPDPAVSAIEAASTPYYDHLLQEYPHATLVTHGEEVGLPDGQMGNSEVGHLNIGAGRIIYQELARINKAVREETLGHNPALLEAIQQTQRAFHLIGLVSDGGVHSHIDHLLALAGIVRQHFNGPIYIHAFTDGRDVSPRSGYGFIERLQRELAPLDIHVASVVGRYYAMDRDNRWERTKIAYDLLVHGHGVHTTDLLESIRDSYEDGITDEFIKPLVQVDALQKATGCIQDNDTVLFFNFRTDRPRQLTAVLSQEARPEWDMHPLHIHMLTMTSYDNTFSNVTALLPDTDITQTLGEHLAQHGKTQLRVAETEKYPHVTYFFSGGRELPFAGETRILIPSPKVPTYDLQPEMSARGITDAVLLHLQAQQPDFICINYANTDMVGHTGVFAAAVKAAETVDACLASLMPVAVSMGYEILIIADHGNADIMVNPDGSPHTAHTKNPVPVIYVSDHASEYDVVNGILADIAPTLLIAMGLPLSDQMTGKSLLSKRQH
jgi:2,3-bisphosphoglycerate-independent phosphoglycerate mutase